MIGAQFGIGAFVLTAATLVQSDDLFAGILLSARLRCRAVADREDIPQLALIGEYGHLRPRGGRAYASWSRSGSACS